MIDARRYRPYDKDKYFAASFRLTKAQAEAVQDFATRHEMSVSEALRYCVDQTIRKPQEVA